MIKRITTVVVAVMVVVVGLASISSAQGAGRGWGNGWCGDCRMTYDGPMDDSALIGKKLGLAINDEYQAQASYADVMDQFGDMRPFSRIVNSEQRHIEALIRLYEKYGLDVPSNTYAGTSFGFASLEEATQTAIDAEIANADMYDDLLNGVSDPDVIRVFENLQWASRERHLPAFESFLENDCTCVNTGCGYGQGRRGWGRGNGQNRGFCRR